MVISFAFTGHWQKLTPLRETTRKSWGKTEAELTVCERKCLHC